MHLLLECKTYYNGHAASITGLKTKFINGKLNVSGTFNSNRPVKDVNIYQDPYEAPSGGYYKIAWSVSPVGNTFFISMPVAQLEQTNGKYNLQIELVLANGETTFTSYPFAYVNGVPNINVNFGRAITPSEIDEADSGQNVYPNPVKDELTINTGTSSDTFEVEITNSFGQKVYKTTTSEKTLKVPFSNMLQGIYFVTIKNNKGVSRSYKIVKQ